MSRYCFTQFSRRYLPFLLFFLLFYLRAPIWNHFLALWGILLIISCSGICWWSMSGSYFLLTWHLSLHRFQASVFCSTESAVSFIFYWFKETMELSRWCSGKEFAWQCRRHRRCRFDPCTRKIPWRRKWQLTPVFLPGKLHGQRILVGYSLWGRKEWDVTWRVSMHAHTKKSISFFLWLVFNTFFCF